MVKHWINLMLAVAAAGNFYGSQAAEGALISAEPEPGPDTLSGSYSISIEGYDWGAGVSRAILSLEAEVDEAAPEQFLVVEEKQTPEHSSADMFATHGELTIARMERTVTSAYLSDEEGQPAEAPSRYITLELAVSPNVGSPLCYHAAEQHYRWAEPYRLAIDLAPGQSITGGKNEYTRLAVSRTPSGESDMPLGGLFQAGSFTHSDGRTLSYASYSPGDDGKRHPLVIWLHGLGEGGTDPLIPVFGSKATAFVDEEFQQAMGNAYVLIPQCPTFWLDDGTGAETVTGQSCYTDSLMALIRNFSGSSPGIDRKRIYIGGCSNGGYMTIALLLEDPDLFAAAFPVCQTYQDRWLSDGDIQLLSQIPIWFSHSELDQVCPPDRSTFPTYHRLLQAGAADVRLSRFGTVADQTGRYRDEAGLPYAYNPHYVWIPVLNNQCAAPLEQSLFDWLAGQRLE